VTRHGRARWRFALPAVLLAALLAGCTTTTGEARIATASGAPAGTATTQPTPDAAPATSSSAAPVPARLSVTAPDRPEYVDTPAQVVIAVQAADGTPVPDEAVTVAISGANTAAVPTCTPADCRTGTDGRVTATYTGTTDGKDQVVASVADLAPSAPATIDWQRSGSRVAVLGDSYSSGEGAGDYLAASDQPGGTRCHRSANAYGPLLVPNATAADLAFRACSGAFTDDLFEASGSAPPQLCSSDCPAGVDEAVGPSTRTVLLTIGGNDAGFASVLSHCLWATAAGLKYGEPGQGCRNSTDLQDAVSTRLDALAGKPAQITGRPVRSYADILTAVHQLAPFADVYLIGYPRLFQPGSGDCAVGTVAVKAAGATASVAVRVTQADAQWLDDQADRINSVAQQAVQGAGSWAHFVDTASTFDGHGICTGASWINGAGGLLVVKSPKTVTPEIDEGSFHPDATGQQGFVTALRAAGVQR
jgi:hypothetical protein